MATIANRLPAAFRPELSEEKLLVAAKAVYDQAVDQIAARIAEQDAKLLEVSRLVEAEIERRMREVRAYVDLKTAEAVEACRQLVERIGDLVKALPAPVVNVEVPPARPVVKDIAYNELGMPVKVVEREVGV